MAEKFYKGNEPDTETKDLLSKELLIKTVKQVVDSDVWTNLFAPFTRRELETGGQWEEIEVADLTSDDFDATGANALTKKDMNFKSLYHKINNRRTFKATVSDAQVKMACLNKENMAQIANAIRTSLTNSSNIEDYENIKSLINDIVKEKKAMVVCDLNDNFSDTDSFIKAIKVTATNMTIPNTQYNQSGFKKAFSKKDNLVLIIDSGLSARIDVDSLAGAFNMDKKTLVSNIIVVDNLPEITFDSETSTKGIEIDIGTATKPAFHKLGSGSDNVSGSVKALLLDKRALVIDPVEREMTEQYNAKGRFTNLYYHVTDVLSYSTLKNAVAFVD